MPFLYFDLGNVLLAFSHERRLKQLAGAAECDVATIEQVLFQPAGQSPFWRMECGQVAPDDVYELFAGLARGSTDRTSFQLAASDIFAPLTDTIALVERLAAAGNRLGVLSNTSPLDWQFALDRFAFLSRLFETHVLSYQVRSMKPAAAIYEEAVTRAGRRASEVFFVDDRLDNVVGALEAGLDAVQFTSVEALAAKLRERGVSGI